ncbi:interaptin-like [Medicago truncatula]|uniref:interaptin-like n=1 Tax=Medicago truncatula TaxID=3880 RepID=UPI000D2F1E39|nr:interaptin-like [Medicago truncatula]
MSKYLDKKQEIANFRQGEGESLYDDWERFNLLLKRCPGHEFSDKQYLQVFTEGLTQSNKMFLDASAGSSLKVKTDHEVQTLIENMANNEYRADVKKKERGVFGVSDTTSILANQAAMNKQIETLTMELHAYQLSNKQQQAAAIKCDLCAEGHPNGECVPEGASEEANNVNYQRQNLYYNSGLNKHPNLSYSNDNTLNPLMPNPQQQQQQRKPSGLEETMMNLMKMAQGNFEEMKKSQDIERKNNEASRKLLETQLGQLAKQLAEQNKGGFSGNTKENPKNETCNAIELRSKKVLTPLVPRSQKKVDEEVVEVEEDGEAEKNVEEVVEKETEHDVVEKESDQGVFENERKKKTEVEKSEKLIDEDSILRKSKSQILKDGDKLQVISSYVKLPYRHLAKKKKKEEGQFKKFINVNGEKKPKDDENIALSENNSLILQRKLPPKLKNPGAFHIPCSIGLVDIGRALCDLGAIINLMPLSMMKKLGGGEPKPTRMTLTLADRSISYPFGVPEDVLVKVNDLVFPADFVILDMAEDEDMPLILGRPFLATGRALVDVEIP